VGALYTVAILVFIVLMNDWADEKVDRLKREMFPQGCSPKTIPDAILPARSLLIVGSGAGLIAAAVAIAGSYALDRPAVAWMGTAGLLTFAAYTLPPLRMNYRGGGELLEAFGVGFLLPSIQVEAQGGALGQSEYAVLAGFAVISLASAIASGLSDEQSDKAGGKRTVASMLGNSVARVAVMLALVGGAASWVVAGFFIEPMRVALLGGASVVIFYALKLRTLSSSALTNEFEAQRRYKGVLHAAIWRGAVVLSALVLLERAIAI
jgi:1,4-dihydroxy-2-naphthoate octaprenyltransferase/chlorophyll synthase